MADHHVSITVEGKTRFTSEGAEEVRRKAAEIGQAVRGAIGDASNLDLGMQRAAQRLSDLNPSKALRESLEAVKEGNLEQARALQRQVVRYGAANPQGGHLEAATALHGVLKAAQTNAEVGGVATAERLQRFLKGYEGRFADLLAPLEEPNATGINSNVPRGFPSGIYANRARRMIHSAHAAIPGALRPGEISGLEGRLESAQRYLERARSEGANTDALKALTDELEKTKGALGQHKEQLGRAQRVLGGRNRQAGGVGRLGRFGQMLEGEMGSLARGMGGLTRVLSLLPEALPFMAVGGAFFAAPAILGAANKQARQQYIGYADLARQFGDRGEVFNQFRSPTGRTLDRFFNLGYSADEAAAAMSAYGQPLRGGGLDMNALQSILTLARGAGLTPDKVASTAATLRREGATTPASMDTLKNAMSAGLQEGIERSDTLTSLLSITQQIYQSGKTLTDAGLRQYAVIQQNLAMTGHPYFQRQAGATATMNVISGISNPQDPGLKALILTHMGDFTAQQLHLNPQQSAYYNKLQGETTMGAREFALTTIAQNPTGPVAQSVAKALQQTVTDPYFRLKILESFGLSGPQALSMAAAGGLTNMLKPGKLPEGTLDTQATTKEGKEALQSRQINVRRADMAVIQSLATLQVTGGLEAKLDKLNVQAREVALDIAKGDIPGALGVLGKMANMDKDITTQKVPGQVAPSIRGNDTGTFLQYQRGQLPPFLTSLRQQESGDDYAAVNTTTKAVGAFQVMPENIGPWTEKYYRQKLTPEEFRNNRQAQNIVAIGVTRDYYARLKAWEQSSGTTLTQGQEEARVLAAWYGGPKLLTLPESLFRAAMSTEPPTGGPDIGDYIKKVGGRFPSNLPAPAFAAGGYTGSLPPSKVAGVVHGSEFVINAEATRRNRALLERINAGSTQAGDTRRVEVSFGGSLPNLRVEGLPEPARRQVQALSQAYMRELARVVTAPQSYHGD